MGTPRPGAGTEESIQALSSAKQPTRRLFGRRKGRPLRTRKSALMKELLPRLSIELPKKPPLDLRSMFHVTPREIWLEIGFGGGEHLAEQARRHPDIGFIGAEPFVNGVASLLVYIDNNKTGNVRVWADDARPLLDMLPEECIARCFILFADPWPKARHAERRFVGPENLPRLARAIKDNGELILASDDPKLIAWTKEQMGACKDFSVRTKPSTKRPENWIETRYEHKALTAGRKPVYSSYLRIKDV
jgi:tRNA (guanine-N7-)-methyltransferase